LEIPKGRGGEGEGEEVITKIFKGKYEPKLKFPEGRRGGLQTKKKTLSGGSMDPFWNNITSLSCNYVAHSLPTLLTENFEEIIVFYFL